MYCPKCNKENPDDARVCQFCNASITDTSEPKHPVTVRTSKLAIASLICALCGLALTVSGLIAIKLSHRSIFAVTFLLSLPTLGAAITLGFISIIRIELSGGRATGRNFAIGAVLISVFVSILPIWMLFFSRIRSTAFRMVCGTNLSADVRQRLRQ